ncbi:hypothetical protein S83_038327, partial [Arachis hypogaea]
GENIEFVLDLLCCPLNKLSKETHGKETTKIVIRSFFCDHVKYTLKIMNPLIR